MNCLRNGVRNTAVAASVLASVAFAGCQRNAITFTIRNEATHEIDDRLFGQFMERPSWGETGPEGALVPGTRQLQPRVLEMLDSMHIPILRFPGGTDVDYTDWRDMIDDVPGREGGRPVTVGHQGDEVANNFGYDEFLRTAERLGAEAIIVVNFREGFLQLKPLEEAARHAAELVAYCSAPVGARLPEGMPDWPAVRAANGRPEPYKVRYWQIGNETWDYMRRARQSGVQGDEPTRYVECLEAYIRAMKAVDPEMEIIVDPVHKPVFNERILPKVDYLAQHYYAPWGMSKVAKGGKDVAIESLSATDIWYAWVSTPCIDKRGLSVLPGASSLPRYGAPVAATEWNWNGWWQTEETPALDSLLAKGVGAAGFVHSLMRAGADVKIATQSMLVGTGWPIAAVFVDKTGNVPARYMPSGQVTALYSKHHGRRMLAMESANVPTYPQPYTMGGIQAVRNEVATIDAIATASDDMIYFHAINRDFDRPITVAIDLSAFGNMPGRAVHHVLQGRLNEEPEPGQDRQIANVTDREARFRGHLLKVELPRRSVSIIEMPRR